MRDAEVIRETLRPRWAGLTGNSFPGDSPYWGCKAYLLAREGGDAELFKTPPGREGWGEPEGPWARFVAGEEDRDRLTRGFEALEITRRVHVREVWDASPRGRSRSRRGAADRHRVLLSNDGWFSGNLLRCFLDMVGWQELWTAPPPSRVLALVRSPTVVEDRRVVGVVGSVATLPRSPYPEWARLWPPR